MATQEESLDEPGLRDNFSWQYTRFNSPSTNFRNFLTTGNLSGTFQYYAKQAVRPARIFPSRGVGK